MKKLTLDVDALKVDQFRVEAVLRDQDGTVIGHARELLSDTLFTTTAIIRYCPNMPNTSQVC